MLMRTALLWYAVPNKAYECARHLLFLLGERDDGGRISSDNWLEACRKLTTSFTLPSDQVTEEKPCLSLPASLAVSREQRASKEKLIFLRCKIEELLYKYCCQHPWVMIFLPPLSRNLFSVVLCMLCLVPYHMFYPIL
jgi:hypothetical protein